MLQLFDRFFRKGVLRRRGAVAAGAVVRVLWCGGAVVAGSVAAGAMAAGACGAGCYGGGCCGGRFCGGGCCGGGCCGGEGAVVVRVLWW
ncbi:hypothetical protein MNL00_06955 [Bartonella krasnovii]|uniref:hypothetical protein n=1 Tax=Bartonella krasnovii TaxID=2267275 RepID=UPI001F4CF82A|nr:hypothetical protein [Bartonella krasnovii]UNF55102.1 hypothetical protein MNL00_06955 [Bartonella krasnovii]